MKLKVLFLSVTLAVSGILYAENKDTGEQRAPDAAQAAEPACNPDTFDVSQLGEKNLIENSRWWFWQREDSMPKGTPKPGSGRNENGIQQITGVTWGSYSQRFPVKPGEIYFFRAEFRIDNEISEKGNGYLTVAFQDSNRKWMQKCTQNHPLAQLDSAKVGEWVTGSIVVTVPPDAAFVSVQLSARNLRPQDSVSFRNAIFIPIPKPQK